MAVIQVFDPALCCSTGVCGVEVDQEMVRFAADVEWLRTNGALIERFNLAQQPMAFADHPVVKDALDRLGQPGLPLILVDGDLRCSGRYPSRDELATWAGVTAAQPVLRAETAALFQRSSTRGSPTAPVDASSGNGSGCCG
jgi:hypothetical protein